MDKVPSNKCEIAPARRGQIVQLVLVDGWTPAQAGAAFGVAERQVVRWVAAYRRLGMRSLRDEPAAEAAPARCWRSMRAAVSRVIGGVGRSFGTDPATCVELRHLQDHRQS